MGGLAAGALALAAGLLLAVPGVSQGALKFGAKLGGDPDPVSTHEQCPDDGGYCTRVPLFYENPSFVGAGPYAPKKGTVDKIKLVSDVGSLFIPQVVKVKGNVSPIAEIKVKEQGPTLHYEGTGEIEVFDVDLPVRKNQRIAMRTQFAGALHCEPGLDNEAIVDPLILPGNVFHDADYYTGCTHLVQAVMEE
jgi:hypothetical protein